MCLNRVYITIKEKEGTGFQVFRVDNSYHIHPVYQKADCPIGVWMTDQRTGRIQIGLNMGSYPTGYHIFLERKSAERFARGIDNLARSKRIAVREVDFKEVVARGTQEGKVVVARQRYIRPKRRTANG